MHEVIKLSIKGKTSFFTALLALLASLSVFLGDLISAILMLLRQQAVPLVVGMAVNLAGIVLGSVLLFLFLNKLIATEQKKRFSLLFILNFFFGICLLQSVNHLLPFLYRPGLSVSFIIAVLLYILAVLLLMIFLMVSYLIVKDQVRLQGYVGVLMLAVKSCVGRFKLFILLFLTALISLSVSIVLFEFLGIFLKNTAMSSFLVVFYRDVLVASMIGVFTIIYFKLVHNGLSHFGGLEVPEASYGRKSAVTGYLLLAVFLIATMYNILPSSAAIPGLVDRRFNQMTGSAENYRNENKLFLCGDEYKKTYALTQAYKGYLDSVQLQKNTKLTDEGKKEITVKIDQSFRTAYDFWPNGGIINYLDGVRQQESNPSNSIVLLDKAVALDPDLQDAYFRLLDLYKINPNKEKKEKIVRILVRDGLYTRSISFGSISTGKISAFLDKYIAREKLCMENINTTAVFYYENKLYQEAMDELTRIQQVIPDDLAVNYMIALTDLELKADGKKYDAAINASQKILKQYPNEDWAQEFATGIAMRAGNQSVMEDSLQKSYKNNPENLDIAEQYAYSLLTKNSDFNYTEAAKQAETIIDGILGKSQDRWFAFYCKAVIGLFKKDYQNSLVHFSKFAAIMADKPDMLAIYDDFYNLYILKYAQIMKNDQNAKTVLDSQKEANPFLYNYVSGAYCWRSSDYDNGEAFLKKAVFISPSLSKPYYLLGNIYFEKAGVLNKQEYYPLAEEQYRKALTIFPEDPFAWFSLAHVLRKTSRLEEALGAFQKALVNMPAEDHNIDHFGISIHSSLQIKEITELLKTKEGH